MRVHIPADWTDEEAAEGLATLLDNIGGRVQKALKSPLPPTDRARARQAFLRLQKSFTEEIGGIFETMDRSAGLVNRVTGEANKAEVKSFAGNIQRSLIGQINAKLSTAYETAFLHGLHAGGTPRELLPNELAIIHRQRINENAYASNFLADIAGGEGSMPYGRRAEMYGRALEEIYWQGYLYADLSPDRYVRWVMPFGRGFKEAEHCPDCSRLSGNLEAMAEHDIDPEGEGGRWGNGVYSAQELAKLGVAPQSGKLTCTTHCHCWLEPAKRPAGKPIYPAKAQFTSFEPKAFTGTEKTESGRVVVTRATEQKRRERLARKAAETEHKHIKRRRRHP